MSEVYVGSISDVELTKISGFLTTLKDKPGVSIMADRGFTIKDMLRELNIDLNLPPFMEGRKQLPANEVQEGRTIASLRIHVERAIGRIKNYSILRETIPITRSSHQPNSAYLRLFVKLSTSSCSSTRACLRDRCARLFR